MSFLEIVNSAKDEGRPCVSFEFFPPKTDELVSKAKQTIARFGELSPDFMTVTYGAGGGTRDRTRELTAFIAQELHTPSVAHLTCVGHSVSEIDSVLNSYKESGVSHILALRGDPPKGADTFEAHPEGFSCARDLASHIHNRSGFSIAVAGYPECHPEASSKESELSYLKEKVRAGAEVIITQLFFDAKHYFQFVEDVRALGLETPVLPGIMPIANAKQVRRFTSMCGATIPEKILTELDEIGDDPEAVKKYGVKAAVSLSESLLDGGAPGLHFYTLNKSSQVEEVCRSLGLAR